MSDIGGKIHNMQENHGNINQLIAQVEDQNTKELIRKAYKEGFRDARHQAQEVLIPFDSAVDDLVEIVRAIVDEPIINLHALGNVPSASQTLHNFNQSVR
ncbi:hypothetical protein PBI_SCTP2_207 [Salicola phage SCTP-2]|nr:hypothetical protein PBI_SCTP2_207 [Salicola phage SCTP-2]